MNYGARCASILLFRGRVMTVMMIMGSTTNRGTTERVVRHDTAAISEESR